MKKILFLIFICFFVFTYCESPADPEIKKALNPGPVDYSNDVSFSCKIDATVWVNTAATGTVNLFLDDVWCGSFNEVDFSPFSDNSSTSEGTISFWKIIPPGTHTFIFRLNHTTLVIEAGYPTPSWWTVKMNVSNNYPDRVINGVQEASFSTWNEGDWGKQKTFTFSISE